MTPEIRAQIIAAFHGSEAAQVAAKRLGIGRDRVYRTWKEEFGEDGVRERGNRLRGLATAGTGNSADPNVQAQAVTAFTTDEPLKKVALRLGVHYTQVRAWWVEAHGDEIVCGRARRLQVERTRENNTERAGEKREIRFTEVPCEKCGAVMHVSAISAAKRSRFLCPSCDKLERGADTPCPVCGMMFVGPRGLASHFAHTEDEAHRGWQEQEEREQLGMEGVDHIVCMECGYRAQNLWKHLETEHRTTPSGYVAKWPGMRWRIDRVEQERLEKSLEVRGNKDFMKGARKQVACPTCGQAHEVSLFAGSLHDLRCVDCKVEDELVFWRGKTEPEDFVTCRECGHRAENLTSHLRSAHQDVDYDLCHPGASVTAQHAGQRDSWSPYQITRDVLLQFAGEDELVVAASVCRAFGCAPNTVVRWCREHGLRTKNRLGWQKAVLDEAQGVLGAPYEWEWSDGRVWSLDTGHVFYFDGYFPAHNLIIEAHGEQHFYFIEQWHRTYEEFERLQELDNFKIARARELGYRVKVVRYSDPIHDRGFWKDLLGDKLTLWSNKTDEARVRDVDAVLEELRRDGFPEVLPSSKTLAEFTKLRHQQVTVDAEMFVRPYTSRGTTVCASFFPNRYEARYRGAPTVREAWDDDDRLRAAIRVQLNAGHPTTAPRVLRALQMICRTPSVFRPGVAKYVCQTFCGPGGVVWDPCAGYGGRLFGAMAADVARYIGTDVEPQTVAGNIRLAEVLGCSDKCEVLVARAEEFDPGRPLDLVFTSPPYFDLEVYGDESKLAIPHGGIRAWIERFLVQLMGTARRALRPGGHLVLNLPAKPLDGVVLADEAVKIASRLGFTVLPVLYMPVRRLRSGEMRADPLLVFRQTSFGV